MCTFLKLSMSHFRALQFSKLKKSQQFNKEKKSRLYEWKINVNLEKIVNLFGEFELFVKVGKLLYLFGFSIFYAQLANSNRKRNQRTLPPKGKRKVDRINSFKREVNRAPKEKLR